GAEATVICGAFLYDGEVAHQLLAQLPPFLHIRGEVEGLAGWLEPMLRFLASETRQDHPGGEMVVNRIVDIIFVQALRIWIDSQPGVSSGWLRALRDSQIGAALERIHEAPAHDWTVAALAAEVAMSRSAFSARFAGLVGEPPLAYLTRWRMHLAGARLREGNCTVAQIAEQLGYQSDVAFSRAFRRQFGAPPGTYRRRRGPSASARDPREPGWGELT